MFFRFPGMSVKLWHNCGEPQFEVSFPQKTCCGCGCGVHFSKNFGYGWCCGKCSLVLTLILWLNCSRTTNLGDFGRKIVLWLGCGVFLEKIGLGLGLWRHIVKKNWFDIVVWVCDSVKLLLWLWSFFTG